MNHKRRKSKNSRSDGISVVVCTLGRYSEIEHCLRALDPTVQKADIPYEVLVIDQNPLLHREILEFSHIKQIYQDELGLSVGRNLGITSSSFDLIAFLDDDAIPCSDWIKQVSATFTRDNNHTVLALGGRVDADWRHGNRPSWMNESLEKYLSCVNWSDTARTIKPHEYIVGANMIFRREVFDQYGMFDPSLGRKGDAGLLSNEETSLMAKVGHERIFYNPLAQAFHIIQPSRFHQAWFRKRVYWQAISDLIGNTVWMSGKDAEEVVADFMLRCPAELRTLRAFHADFSDEKMMSRQLNAIYAHTLLGSQGFLSQMSVN